MPPRDLLQTARQLHALMGDIANKLTTNGLVDGTLVREVRSLATKLFSRAEENVPKLVLGKISKTEIEHHFGLKWSDKELEEPQQNTPCDLGMFDNFCQKFQKVTSLAPENEAKARTILDVLNVDMLSQINDFFEQTNLPEARLLNMQFETPFDGLVNTDHGRVLVSGFADYTIFYGQAETRGTNLVCIEAKRSNQHLSRECQLLGAMAFVQARRKEEQKASGKVYGILSDGERFTVYCLLGDKTYTTIDLRLSQRGPRQQLINILWMIFRALQSPL